MKVVVVLVLIPFSLKNGQKSIRTDDLKLLFPIKEKTTVNNFQLNIRKVIKLENIKDFE